MDWKAYGRTSIFLPVLVVLMACAGQVPVEHRAGSSLTDKATSGASVEKMTEHACAAGVWYCDSFEDGSTAGWVVNPAGGGKTVGQADGKLGVTADKGKHVLRYDAGQFRGVAAVISDAAFLPVTRRNSADYYVEARIRPIDNQSHNKFVCLLGRYQDVNNWYGACLNVQNGGSSKVEFHRAHGGKWFRTKQFSPRVIKNGLWYTLRLEMKGPQLTFYIDNDLVGSVKNTELTAAGKIGFWLDNRSFEVSEVSVGDANVHPSQLTIDPQTTWKTQVGEADLDVAVNASRPDGSADDFSVLSSNPGVVSVAVSGRTVRLHAHAAGTATVTYTSGSKPDLQKTLAVEVEPEFVMPDQTYGSLKDRAVPAAGDPAAYIDGTLRLAFDGVPELTGKGSVRIFDAQDDHLVDVIRPEGEADAIGPSADGRYRNVAMPLMHVEGHRLLVRPHARHLQYHQRYYVVIEEGTLRNAILNGHEFSGLGKRAGWSFSTRMAPAAGLRTVMVSPAGTSATFRSVQGALDYAMQENSGPITVHLAPGRYEELLYLRGRNDLTLVGAGRDKSIIAFDNYESLNSGSGISATHPGARVKDGGRAVMLVEDSDLLTLRGLTLQNTHIKRNGINNQAETIFFNGDAARLIARDMNFISRQDTLQLNAYSWFYNTLVAGDVDFIWGSPKAALFENSEIRTVVDSSDATKGGYIVQARVLQPSDKGFVFLNSRITREAGVPDGATVLARSAGVPRYFDNVIYVRCAMDPHISSSGWMAHPVPNPAQATTTQGWREFASTTVGAGSHQQTNVGRDAVSLQLGGNEVAPYASRGQVFSAIHWDPQP